MFKIEERIKKMAALTGVILMATAEALAQDHTAGPAKL